MNVSDLAGVQVIISKFKVMKKVIPALAIAAIVLGLSGSAALAKESGNRGGDRGERTSEHRDSGDRSGDHRESRNFDRNMMIDWDNDGD